MNKGDFVRKGVSFVKGNAQLVYCGYLLLAAAICLSVFIWGEIETVLAVWLLLSVGAATMFKFEYVDWIVSFALNSIFIPITVIVEFLIVGGLGNLFGW